MGFDLEWRCEGDSDTGGEEEVADGADFAEDTELLAGDGMT